MSNLANDAVLYWDDVDPPVTAIGKIQSFSNNASVTKIEIDAIGDSTKKKAPGFLTREITINVLGVPALASIDVGMKGYIMIEWNDTLSTIDTYTAKKFCCFKASSKVSKDGTISTDLTFKRTPD